MDLSLFFAGTAGSVPTARRGLPALLRAARRRPHPVRLRRGHAAPAAALGRPAGPRRRLPHALPRRPLARPAGDAEDVRPARARAAADVYGPPGLRELLALDAPRVRAARLRRARSSSWRPTSGRARRLRDRSRSRSATAAPRYGYALVEDDRPGRFDAALAERLGVNAGPDFGRLQRGETVERRAPEQVIGEAAAGRKLVISGDTAPCDMLRDAAYARRPARARGDLHPTRRPTAPRETRHSTAAQAAEIAREAEVRLLALDAPLDPLRRPRDPRGGARGLPGHASCRATSTRSRSRSRSAARPSSCAGRTASQRRRRPPRWGRVRRPRPVGVGARCYAAQRPFL